MASIPVGITFDNMGNAADIGRGAHLDADPDEPGLRTGYPRLEEMLTELCLPATFFVEGWNALHHGYQIERLLERGHEVALHGWVHEQWSTLEPRQERAILAAGKAALDSLGANVSGFRAPGGDRNPGTLQLLADLGFDYDSSAGRDFIVDTSGIAILPFTWPNVDWWWYKVRQPFASAEVWADGWRNLLSQAAVEGSPVVLIAHARVSAVDPERAAGLHSILKLIADDNRFRPVLMRDLRREIAGTHRVKRRPNQNQAKWG